MNENKDIKLLIKMAKAGDAESQHQLGLYYYHKAVEMFKDAAANGHEESKVMVIIFEHIISLGTGNEDVFIQ